MIDLMQRIVPAVGLALSLAAAGTTAAHSLKSLEALLGDKEKYFEPLDRLATGFMLRTADGETVRLSGLRGKVVVLHFVYAGCPDICPLHADRIAEVQAMVNRTPMKDLVRFVTITTNPVNDTAAVLRDYGPVHGLDPINWTFLTTPSDQPEDATRRLAEAYGHRFEKTEDGNQVHGVVSHVIDGAGRWRGNFHGLRFSPTSLVLFINALINDAYGFHEHGEASWWKKLKELF